MARIVIVGGGLSGLSLAYRLEQRLPGAEVLVLEQRDRVGGNINTLDRDGFRVEAGPNGFLDNKPATLSLCRDLGLGERLQPASDAAGRNRFLFLNGRLRLLPGSLWSFLRSDILSWSGKIRVLTGRWRRPRLDPGEESIESFAIRRRRGGSSHPGRCVCHRHPRGRPRPAQHRGSFSPLGYPRARTRQRAARPCRPSQTAPPGRSQPGATGSAPPEDVVLSRGTAFTDRHSAPAAEEPAAAGSCRSRDKANARPRPDSGRLPRRSGGRDSWTADRVVLACPAYQQAEILADLDPALADKVAGIAYNRIAVVALGFRAADVPTRLDGFGFLTPQRERRDVLGVRGARRFTLTAPHPVWCYCPCAAAGIGRRSWTGTRLAC